MPTAKPRVFYDGHRRHQLGGGFNAFPPLDKGFLFPKQRSADFNRHGLLDGHKVVAVLAEVVHLQRELEREGCELERTERERERERARPAHLLILLNQRLLLCLDPLLLQAHQVLLVRAERQKEEGQEHEPPRHERMAGVTFFWIHIHFERCAGEDVRHEEREE